MEKSKFIHHMEEATKQVLAFTRSMCFNELSENVIYLIEPNCRIIEESKHLNADEISILKSWNKHANEQLSFNKVIQLLHHDNKVPVWIDTYVTESSQKKTVITLLCSRRLRHEAELNHPGIPPFHVQVLIPPDQYKNEVDGKFDLNWKKKLRYRMRSSYNKIIYAIRNFITR